MHTFRKLTLLLMAFAAIAAFAAGCGGDDENSETTPAAESTPAEPAPSDTAAEEPAAGEIDQATLEQFVEAVNQDPTLLCDPENVTAEFLEGVGGEASCQEQAAQQPPGGEYELSDVQIDGANATAVITDDDGPQTVTFVQEGEELKVASVEQG
jgi:hypothetical protein